MLEQSADGPRLRVRWLINGDIEINASAWVGVVRFSSVDVHVTPKVLGSNQRLLKLLDYTRGTRFLRTLENRRPLGASGESLVDLLSALLAEEAATLLREGLLRRYRPTHEDLAMVRGRIDHRTQLLRHFGRLDRLRCSFDEHDADNVEHQLVCAGLDVARGVAVDTTTRSNLNRLRSLFVEACTPPPVGSAWYRGPITYSRLNERYRAAHELAYLLLENIAFDDLYDTDGRLGVRSFLLNMNSLFEEFVSKVFSDALAGSDLIIAPKQRLREAIVHADTRTTHSPIVPDIVLAKWSPTGSPEPRLPIDCKYKLYDERSLSTADIYQMFTYALALSAPGYEPRAGIVYPGLRTAVTTRLDVTPRTGPARARITGVSLQVPDALDQIRLGSALPSELVEQIRDLVRAIAVDFS